MSAAFHDEWIIECKGEERFYKEIERMANEGVKEVGKEFMLRRELDCDVQVGKRYSEIH